MIAGLVVSYAIAVGWMYRSGDFVAPVRLRWATLRVLWASGFPIWLIWLPLLVLGDVDQWLIVSHLGTRELGLYSIAMI